MTRRVLIVNAEDPNSLRQIVVSTFTPDMAVQGHVEVVNPGREIAMTVHPNQMLLISDRMPDQVQRAPAVAEDESPDDQGADDKDGADNPDSGEAEKPKRGRKKKQAEGE